MCPNCSHNYAIRNGIPNMVRSGAFDCRALTAAAMVPGCPMANLVQSILLTP